MRKNILLSIFVFTFLVSCSPHKKEDYVPLFNGKDLTNWTLQKPGGFEVIDGELITRSSGNGTDLFSEKWYGNFILRLEFLLSEVGNSGVFIRCKPYEPGEGFEVQLLAPWTPWRDDLHCTGSLYGHVAVSDRPDETTGVWYNMEISCDRSLITVSVDEKIVTMVNTDTVKSMISKPFFGVIGFQGNHSHVKEQFARFRNICIRNLDTDPAYVIKGFYEMNDQLRNLALVAAVGLGAEMIQPLADLMSGSDPVARNTARQALFDIVAKASDPEAPEKEKKDVTSALGKSIKNTSSEAVKKHLIWLSGLII